MALNRPALVDALTDAGLEAEAVRRAVDVLEQSYADTAKQSEMHLRFDALEKSLADHDRLNEEQRAGVDKQFEAVDKQFEALNKQFDGQFDGVNKQFEAVNKQFDAADKQSKSLSARLQDFKDEVDRRFVDLKESMDREFAAVRSEMATGFAAVRSEMASMRSELSSEIASVRRELNGKITMLQWMIGVLFVMNGTTLGIVIAKLL